MEIGEEMEPVEVPLPAHPDEMPGAPAPAEPAPEPAEPERVSMHDR